MTMICYLSCSQKLRKGAGVAVSTKAAWPDSAPPVFRWRADVYAERRSSVAILFTNAETLYSYFIVKDGVSRYEDAIDEFSDRLAADLLQLGGIDVGRSRAIQFTGTPSRSLISSMNNLMEEASVSLERGREVEAFINTMPFKALGFALPVEEWGSLVSDHGKNESK